MAIIILFGVIVYVQTNVCIDVGQQVVRQVLICITQPIKLNFLKVIPITKDMIKLKQVEFMKKVKHRAASNTFDNAHALVSKVYAIIDGHAYFYIYGDG